MVAHTDTIMTFTCPSPGDVVEVQITEYTVYGVRVKLIDYDDLEGMITLTEISRRRFNITVEGDVVTYAKKHRRSMNKVYEALVLRVKEHDPQDDGTTKPPYIDLSFRRIKEKNSSKDPSVLREHVK